MAIWQIALILLAVVWALQAVGTWMQVRHYRDVMGSIGRRWSDGYVGAGNARGGLGRGVILILVVSPDDIVRRVAIMEGRSVFAKFKRIEAFEGVKLTEIAAAMAAEGASAGRQQALARAIEQVERAKASRQSEQTGSLRLATA